MIQNINSSSWTISLFIIITNQNHLEDWYRNNFYPSDWIIGTNENGWIINEFSFEWIKYFDQYIRSCIIDVKYLLILDNYNNHYSYEFEYYYKENNIIILYISPYSFYLFQSFDIGYFNILKQLYNKKVENFI